MKITRQRFYLSELYQTSTHRIRTRTNPETAPAVYFWYLPRRASTWKYSLSLPFDAVDNALLRRPCQSVLSLSRTNRSFSVPPMSTVYVHVRSCFSCGPLVFALFILVSSRTAAIINTRSISVDNSVVIDVFFATGTPRRLYDRHNDIISGRCF
jgi:hypothetical protein